MKIQKSIAKVIQQQIKQSQYQFGISSPAALNFTPSLFKVSNRVPLNYVKSSKKKKKGSKIV
jgi:hypothetical protein